MMTRTLKLQITAGDTTCAAAPGKWCPFVRTRRFGSEFLCQVFDKELHDKDGWLQRLPECLTSEHATTNSDLLSRS